MIDGVVPACVATAETREDIAGVELFPEEQRSLGRAVEKRRREFITGRACARRALERLGVGTVPIASGDRGEPLWPAGVVGSITHCPGYCACAVARSEDLRSIGIDAEPNTALPDGVLEQVAFGRELDLVAAIAPVRMDRLLFSAKEAVFKAWFPLMKRWLGFDDAEVSVDPDTNRFCARLRVPGPVVNGVELTAFHGRWCVHDGIICTAVVL